jgi:hypothetical protein
LLALLGRELVTNATLFPESLMARARVVTRGVDIGHATPTEGDIGL